MRIGKCRLSKKVRFVLARPNSGAEEAKAGKCIVLPHGEVYVEIELELLLYPQWESSH